MIKINKDVDIPTILTNQGAIAEQELCDLYDENPDSFIEPEWIFEFYDNIFGHDSVRSKLIECQHNKCCYSEAKFCGDFPHVEHFRPKTRVNEGVSENMLYPGYYWLAYRWDNLFLSKQAINTSLKRNFFPLEDYDENNRARNHHMDISEEHPLLIDPSEEPRDHIRFHDAEPYAFNGSSRGQYTIDLLLNEPGIADGRLTLIGILEGLKDSLIFHEKQNTEESLNEAIKIRIKLKSAILPKAEFSSMVNDYLSK